MVFPQVDYLEWAKEHGLKVSKQKCFRRKCKNLLITNIPFISKHGCGLISSRCICGMSGEISTLSVKSGKFENLINSFNHIPPNPPKSTCKIIPFRPSNKK